ncbi:MAG: FHA domain-containing protein [Lachnospiraceae bacterium]|nr:FHA domain-containing protein [Lachnospiraceae bacterium]
MRKKWSILWIIPALFLHLCIIVHATETDAGNENKSSVLQLVVMYTDEDGIEHPVQGGSGFLIGDEESGAGYVITAKEVTTVSEAIAEQVVELYTEDKEVAELDYTIKAVIRRDVMIDAQIVVESDEMGVSIWKLSQPLYDRKPLVLCDDDLTDIMGQDVSVFGFPTAPSLETEPVYYTMDDVISQNGAFIGDGIENNVKYLYHNIVPSQGFIGGPILNSDGNVVAVFQSKQAQNGYYSLEVSEIIPVLEALGIPYNTTGKIAAELQAELDAMVHKEELQELINEAEMLDGKLYTVNSYNALTETLTVAQEINNNSDATQEEVDTAVENLKLSIEGLEEKIPIWIIVVVVALIILVVSLIVVIVLMKTKPKRDEKKLKKLEEITVTEAAPVFDEQKVQKEDYKKLVTQNIQCFEESKENNTINQYEGFGETTVFQQDDADSMELYSGNTGKHAYLIRKRTCEKIIISEDEFVLGKDASQTDYCINGNSAISRAHAVIIYKNSQYDVSDKNATNGTFVNDVKVAPFQKASLKDGDILRLADENFEFRIGE